MTEDVSSWGKKNTHIWSTDVDWAVVIHLLITYTTVPTFELAPRVSQTAGSVHGGEVDQN